MAFCFAVSHSQSLHLQVKKSSLRTRAEGSPLYQQPLPRLFTQVTSQSAAQIASPILIDPSVCLVACYIPSIWRNEPINLKYHLCLKELAMGSPFHRNSELCQPLASSLQTSVPSAAGSLPPFLLFPIRLSSHPGGREMITKKADSDPDFVAWPVLP